MEAELALRENRPKRFLWVWEKLCWNQMVMWIEFMMKNIIIKASLEIGREAWTVKNKGKRGYDCRSIQSVLNKSFWGGSVLDKAICWHFQKWFCVFLQVIPNLKSMSSLYFQMCWLTIWLAWVRVLTHCVMLLNWTTKQLLKHWFKCCTICWYRHFKKGFCQGFCQGIEVITSLNVCWRF